MTLAVLRSPWPSRLSSDYQSAIAQLESIQEKVARTLAEWGRGRDLGGSITLDAAFYTALDRRLTAAERATLGERTENRDVGPANRGAGNATGDPRFGSQDVPRVYSQTSYRNERAVGMRRRFPNETLAEEGAYSERGMPDGTWRRWNDDGQLIEEIVWDDGKVVSARRDLRRTDSDGGTRGDP